MSHLNKGTEVFLNKEIRKITCFQWEIILLLTKIKKNYKHPSEHIILIQREQYIKAVKKNKNSMQSLINLLNSLPQAMIIRKN